MRSKDQELAKILGVNLSSTSPDKVLKFVSSKLKKKRKFYIVTPNPEIIVAAQKSKDLVKFLNNADISLPDGVGLMIVAKILGLTPIRRIRGREMMLKLFELANEKKLKIFLLGSSPEVIKASIDKVNRKYPNIKISGFSGPKLDSNAEPISEIDIKLQIDSLSKIDRIQPNLLFVAFGAPKQELWLQKHFKNLQVDGAMVVGGSLDYFSGKAKLPPKLLADLGLEWLWRMINEPKRIKRIINATVVFPLLVLKEKLTAQSD